MWLLAHLSQWLVSEGLGVNELRDARLQRFMQARQAAGRTQLRSVKALGPLMGYYAISAWRLCLSRRHPVIQWTIYWSGTGAT